MVNIESRKSQLFLSYTKRCHSKVRWFKDTEWVVRSSMQS